MGECHKKGRVSDDKTDYTTSCVIVRSADGFATTGKAPLIGKGTAAGGTAEIVTIGNSKNTRKAWSMSQKSYI